MTTKTQDKHKMSEIDESISKIFDIKKRLGKGAYGIVWKALDKRSNETVAVKKIFDAFRDETDAQRTFREIMFLKALRNHPNIVKLHNVYKASNNLDIYLIFEYMESDLHNIIKKGTILKDIHKRYVMYQLINAIKYIHSGNVIHRDLKPSNVLIDSKCRCKLADFGLARSVAMRGDINDTGADQVIQQPLLTDYVATRWYRAPEILVASKSYTKGIDMWSLGCILGEMIRGKPIFQGSSTVNQIEKIVYTLPDITDHDIKSVGAGFGSVLLNKQISKEKKITLNDLISGATGDALDLIKSLLVLDPSRRLTAKKALNHPYVEKFRNSIPELELNVDILPPFRDDVRLTVPEYRSKLYEFVQVHGEKSRPLDANKNTAGVIKNREHKSPQNEKFDSKKQLKVKQTSYNYIEDKNIVKDKSKIELESQQHISGSLNTIINRAVKATTTPTTSSQVAKRKNSKTKKHVIADTNTIQQNNMESNMKDARYLHRSKSHGHHQHKLGCDDLSKSTTAVREINIKRYSIKDNEIAGQTVNDSPKILHNSQRLHRSAVALNRTDSVMNSKIEQLMRNTPPQMTRNFVRNTKSEDMSLTTNAFSTDSPKVQEHLCYERRLKKLEEDIKRVKYFCRENSNQKQYCQEIPKNKPENNVKSLNNSKYTFKKSHNKSDLDLSGNSGNGSSDNFRHSYYFNSCSGRGKHPTKYQYNIDSNNIHNYQELLQQQQQLGQQSKQYRVTQKHQHRCRPISEFI